MHCIASTRKTRYRGAPTKHKYSDEGWCAFVESGGNAKIHEEGGRETGCARLQVSKVGNMRHTMTGDHWAVLRPLVNTTEVPAEQSEDSPTPRAEVPAEQSEDSQTPRAEVDEEFVSNPNVSNESSDGSQIADEFEECVLPWYMCRCMSNMSKNAGKLRHQIGTGL